MTQINPPFDGSAPCPMCNQTIRGISATAHNMLNRWRAGDKLPEPKFWIRLDDLRRAARGEAGYADPAKPSPPIEDIKSDNAEVQAHLDAIREVLAEYANHEQPTNNARAQPIADLLAPLVDKLRATVKPVDKLSEAHFDDSRHCSGEPNILREQRGWSEERGGDYNWYVEKALPAAAPDLIHKVCGVRLVIHEHFKERIRRDPTFYAKVYCRTCGINAPEAQFECRVA